MEKEHLEQLRREYLVSSIDSNDGVTRYEFWRNEDTRTLYNIYDGLIFFVINFFTLGALIKEAERLSNKVQDRFIRKGLLKIIEEPTR